MRKFLMNVLALMLGSTLVIAQDLIDEGDIGAIEAFRVDLDDKFSFGEVYQKASGEDPISFVKRILADQSTMHHGAFELKGFRNSIVSFAAYEFNETPVIIGLLLEPVNTRGGYRLLKTMEMSSGCRKEPEVVSVFLHDADPNILGRELIVQTSDYCGRHGTFNSVFVYDGLISDHKLKLTTHLTEHCDYSEVKIGGEWDYDLGEEGVEDRRYTPCNYGDFKLIRAHFDALNEK